MKKYFSLMMMAVMALSLATVSTSCTDDDDDYMPSVDNSAVVGNWGAVTKRTGTNNPEWTGFVTFKTDGTMSITNEDESLGKWNLNGNILEVTNESEKVVATIKKTDEITLVLEYKDEGKSYTMLMKRVEPQPTTKNLVGMWLVDENTSSDPDIELEMDNITFKAEGTCISNNTKGKWQLNGQAITFTYKGESLTGVVTNYETVEMTIEFEIDGCKVTAPMLRIE